MFKAVLYMSTDTHITRGEKVERRPRTYVPRYLTMTAVHAAACARVLINQVQEVKTVICNNPWWENLAVRPDGIEIPESDIEHRRDLSPLDLRTYVRMLALTCLRRLCGLDIVSMFRFEAELLNFEQCRILTLLA